jgi:transcriptional regulator with XRE-family HTH domain
VRKLPRDRSRDRPVWRIRDDAPAWHAGCPLAVFGPAQGVYPSRWIARMPTDRRARMKHSDRIRFARRRTGLTQAGLAKALGVQRSAVSNWESARGSRPSATNMIALAWAAAVSVEWLTTGRGRVAVDGDGAGQDAVPAVDAELVEDPGERELLASYRMLPPRLQLMAQDLLRELARGRKPG